MPGWTSPLGAPNGTAHALGTLRYVVRVSNAWLACGPAEDAGWEGSHVVNFFCERQGRGDVLQHFLRKCCIASDVLEKIPSQTNWWLCQGFFPEHCPSIGKAWFIFHGIPPRSTEINWFTVNRSTFASTNTRYIYRKFNSHTDVFAATELKLYVTHRISH